MKKWTKHLGVLVFFYSILAGLIVMANTALVMISAANTTSVFLGGLLLIVAACAALGLGAWTERFLNGEI